MWRGRRERRVSQMIEEGEGDETGGRWRRERTVREMREEGE